MFVARPAVCAPCGATKKRSVNSRRPASIAAGDSSVIVASRSTSNDRPITDAAAARSRAGEVSRSARASTASASVSGTPALEPAVLPVICMLARNSSTCSGIPSLRVKTAPVISLDSTDTADRGGHRSGVGRAESISLTSSARRWVSNRDRQLRTGNRGYNSSLR